MSIQGFNPLATTNAANSFAIKSEGYIQGVFQDDPGLRFQLAGGLLGPNETIPMWGGVLISETTTPTGSAQPRPQGVLGGYITRATSIPTSHYTPSSTAGIATGFSVFNGANAMLNWPQNPVPVALNGGQVNFIRFGCGLLLPVACSSILADLEGDVVSSQVSWDTSAQELIPYEGGFSNTTITGAVWAGTSGGQTTFAVSSDLTADLSAGDLIEVTGVVNTGGTSTSAFNGQWEVVSLTSSHIVVTQAASVSPGTYSSGGTVLGQGGALPVRVSKIEVGNSMTVSYNPATGLATWNRSGSVALIIV